MLSLDEQKKKTVNVLKNRDLSILFVCAKKKKEKSEVRQLNVAAPVVVQTGGENWGWFCWSFLAYLISKISKFAWWGVVWSGASWLLCR